MATENSASLDQLSHKPLLNLLAGGGSQTVTPPVWLMRQAGRYLPEYKKIRAECDSFLSLCYNPKKASEVTLQPLQRFDLDGAILFSDILVVADGMGCPPVFDEKRGPVFTPIREASAIKALVPPLADDPKFLQVAEAAERVASRLAPEKTLLGFCGSPYSVAFYMVEGSTSRDALAIRTMASVHPERFDLLLSKIAVGCCAFLDAQIKGGVEAVQLFESLGSHMNARDFHRFIVQPMKVIVAHVRQRHPRVPIILFGRGLGHNMNTLIDAVKPNAVSVDHMTSMQKMHAMHPEMALQGNLDPMVLCGGGMTLDRHIRLLKEEMQGKRWIANLGHGILKETPIDHVARFVAAVKGAA